MNHDRMYKIVLYKFVEKRSCEITSVHHETSDHVTVIIYDWTMEDRDHTMIYMIDPTLIAATIETYKHRSCIISLDWTVEPGSYRYTT